MPTVDHAGHQITTNFAWQRRQLVGQAQVPSKNCCQHHRGQGQLVQRHLWITHGGRQQVPNI